MALFARKVFKAEVIRGVDLEAKTLLLGDRVTVGSGPSDTLRLEAPGIVPGHVTFQRSEDGKGWGYFTTDRSSTGVDRGNPRTGRVRAGMWFDLGFETRLALSKVPAPADLQDSAASGEKTEIPLGVALPVLGLMAVGAAAVVTMAGGSDPAAATLRTTAWFNGAADLAPAVEACLAAGLSPEAATIAGTDALATDALYRAALTDPGAADALRREVRAVIAEAHLLAGENRADDAARAIRRMENVLPVGNGDCPILQAARTDLAVLTMMADRARN